MKKEQFFQRGWAETVRLYSGLLSDVERDEFIKFIAEKNILLAAECRSTSILPETDLDNYLTKIALSEAKKFKSSATSANGIMALIELNRFDEITQIFSSLTSAARTPLYNQVVSNYVANGSEIQISTFILVLASSNESLLERAIDRAFDLNVFFSPASINQLEKLATKLYEESQLRICGKIICIISKKIPDVNATILLEALLKAMEVSYAEKLIKVYKLKPNIDTCGYLSIYVRKGLYRDAVLKFLNLCKRNNAINDVKGIRIELSKHLNPKMKALAFEYEADIPLSEDTIYKIYIENIRIGNVSSIEFALSLVDRFKLSGKVGIENVIASLLSTPKGRRLELAFTLTKKYALWNSFPYQIFFDYAINALSFQSITFARKVVLDIFPESKVSESLLFLCCLCINELSATKVARDIIFTDMQRIESIERIEENAVYYGYVANLFKGKYQIDIGINGLQINVSKSLVGWLNLHDFIKYRLITKNEKVAESSIVVVEKNIIKTLTKKYYFGNIYIGKILTLKVEAIVGNRVILKSFEFLEYRFLILIGDISDSYVKRIYDFLNVNDEVQAKVIRVDTFRMDVYCTVKYLKRKETNVIDDDESLSKMINVLKQKFAK